MITAASKPVVGIIGGTGVHQLEGLANARWVAVDSPFGRPSDELLCADFNGQQVVFLPRHGRGHKIPPSGINYRANIDALKRLGVTEVISLSAVGSLREELEPGTLVIVDQFIDRTFAREKSFFGAGLVAHVSMAKPVCARLARHLIDSAHGLGFPVASGGVYLAMEGPQFSTLAESELHRFWGCHVIGMTNMPEAKLAREAELCYAVVAMVTDYDCWHPDHGHVTVSSLVKVLQENANKARAVIKEVLPRLKDHAGPCAEGCQTALDSALVTAPEARDPEMVKRLETVAGRVLGR